MMEQVPKSPFRDREENEKTPLAEEIKAVLGIFELTRRLRAKIPDKDIDKPRENVSESAGDQTAMTAYLMHYFLPLVQKEGLNLKYEKVLDMVLAHNIGDIGNTPPMPGVQLDLDQRRDEIVATAKVFDGLPQRRGFNKDLFFAYAEYLGQETQEARFVRALNGLETMLYVLSRPTDELRKSLVGGKGYALEDYRERIEPFCREFPPLRKFYVRIERIFHQRRYFAESRVYRNQVMRPEMARSLFLASAPEFKKPRKIDVRDENDRLLRLQRLKRHLRFGQETKSDEEHNDTVPEHISALLYLERYFLPAIKADPRQREKERLSLYGGNAKILAHDMPEVIRGDVIAPLKTEQHSLQEWDDAVDIAVELAPRAEAFNEAFWRHLQEYEVDRYKLPFVGDSWRVKVYDVFEAQEYIYDPRTRGKLSKMQILPRDEVRRRIGGSLELFPVVKQHFDELESRFKREGIR